MKKLVLSIAVVIALLTLLSLSVGLPVASADEGLHTGYETGQGHTDFPGSGLGLGHDKHECDPTCPLCGGYPCIPPCPGV